MFYTFFFIVHFRHWITLLCRHMTSRHALFEAALISFSAFERQQITIFLSKAASSIAARRWRRLAAMTPSPRHCLFCADWIFHYDTLFIFFMFTSPNRFSRWWQPRHFLITISARRWCQPLSFLASYIVSSPITSFSTFSFARRQPLIRALEANYAIFIFSHLWWVTTHFSRRCRHFWLLPGLPFSFTDAATPEPLSPLTAPTPYAAFHSGAYIVFAFTVLRAAAYADGRACAGNCDAASQLYAAAAPFCWWDAVSFRCHISHR